MKIPPFDSLVWGSYIYMKIPLFDSLVWGSLRLTPINSLLAHARPKYTPLFWNGSFFCTNYYGNKAEIHRSLSQSPDSTATMHVWGRISLNYIAQSQDCRSNQYQRSHVKSVPEKWIKSRIFSLSYTKKVGSSIHLGQVKLMISLSSQSMPTLTVCVGFLS